MNCPNCGAPTLTLIYPPKGFETYGTAQAICKAQRRCDWKSGHVATEGNWEGALEARAMERRLHVHRTTVAAANGHG